MKLNWTYCHKCDTFSIKKLTLRRNIHTMNDKKMPKLVKIKSALKKHLPSSIQLYNIIVCEISQDGIERRVFVNEDLNEENIAVVVINKLESPKNIISLYCTDNCTEQLRILIKENVSWGANNEFEVKRKCPHFGIKLGINQKNCFIFSIYRE